jgi:hypothetical protein
MATHRVPVVRVRSHESEESTDMVPIALLGPRDRISAATAAHILGCSMETVRRHVAAGWLGDIPYGNGRAMSRSEVEALASQLYPWRRHVHDERSYWVTGQQAADMLGITVGRLDQLSDAHHIPFVRHEDRTRLYRRRELELLPLRDRRSG